MKVMHKTFHWLFSKRLAQLMTKLEKPFETQELLLQSLVKKAANTSFGRQFNFPSIKNVASFQKNVPLFTYEKLYPYIERILKGEQYVLWPKPIQWFAKSSGTTNSRSKYIPVSSESLQEGHYKAGKDLLALYIANNPSTKLIGGKNIAMAGSLSINQLYNTSSCGDISAVILKNLPFWTNWHRTPSLSTALLNDWEAKIEKMAAATVHKKITSIAGIPTWTWLFLQKILAISNTSSIHDVWPNFELFIHGAVSFKPYKHLFQSILQHHVHYMEVYSASEGFFAIQDRINHTDMLLLLNHGIFYEFIPLDELSKSYPKVVQLAEVALGKIYAIIISTNAGLWRYQIGDTIKFTSKNPFRIKIVGRTKHFINIFGEELIIDNAEIAISKACLHTNAIIANYTAGPSYMDNQKTGQHEWIIEFIQAPNDSNKFITLLDQALQETNTDYQAKRQHNLVLTIPKIHHVPQGTFYQWMKKRGKLGGQYKVPRLANHRKYLKELLAIIDNT